MATPAIGGGVAVDYGAMARAASVLDTAGADLDARGGCAPAAGGAGDAAALVAVMLGAFAESASRVSAESGVLAAAVQVFSSGLYLADVEQAVAILTNGAG